MLHRLYSRFQRLRRLVRRRRLTLGVRAIVSDDAGRICLVRHTYREGWHLPGGTVKAGESLGVAMSRELLEETGLEAAAVPQKVHGVYSLFRDDPNHHVVVFVVGEWTVTPRMSHEIAEVGFFETADLPAATSPATSRRIKEFMIGAPTGHRW
ncbi:MAG TPA: DNA mismatch repair protein MutT [Acidimicrobiaceae bacterium]|nr:DNA mismatch repair protein MutT [Acidimicrobiaceae bacterium]